MDKIKTLKVVLSDDISAFLSNSNKIFDCTRTYSLNEINKKGLNRPHKCSNRQFESLGPIIEGIVGGLGKQQSTKNGSNNENSKLKKIPNNSNGLKLTKILASHNADEQKTKHEKMSEEKINFSTNAAIVNGSPSASISELSEVQNEAFSASSNDFLTLRGQKINEGCENVVEKSIAKSVNDLKKSEQIYVKNQNFPIKNCEVFLTDINSAESKSFEKSDSLKTTDHKVALSQEKNCEVSQHQNGILHTNVTSNHPPEREQLLSVNVEIHDISSVRRGRTKNYLPNSEKVLDVDLKSSKNEALNRVTEKFPVSPSSVKGKNSEESTVVPHEVLNKSRYGRPLKKRFDLSTEISKTAEYPYQTKRLTKNKVTNSTKVSNNFTSNSVRLENFLSADVSKAKNENAKSSSRQKYIKSNFAGKGQSQDGFYSGQERKVQDSSKCKKDFMPSNLNEKESNITNIFLNGSAIKKNNEIEEELQTDKIIKEPGLKSDEKKSILDKRACSTDPKETCNEPVKASRYGRVLKKVSLDHNLTPHVVRELRNRMPVKCKKNKLFTGDINSGELNPPSSNKENYNDNEGHKLGKNQPISVQSPQNLRNKTKNSSKKAAKGKKQASEDYKENIVPENNVTHPKFRKRMQKPVEKQSSRKTNHAQKAELQQVTAGKGTLKRLQQRHKRQQYLLSQQQQQQEDEVAELLAENPHLLARNQFRMEELLQTVSSPSSNRGSNTPYRTVDSSSLLPVMSPVSPCGSVSLDGLSFSTPRCQGDWHWLKNTPANRRSGSPVFGGNCNLLLTPVVPDTNDVHRIIFNKGKGCKRKKRKLSSIIQEEAPTAALQSPSGSGGAKVVRTAGAKSAVRRKGKHFNWLELPSNPTPNDTDDTNDEGNTDMYFDDSI